jgi:type VI protein secretion system component Hcp
MSITPQRLATLIEMAIEQNNTNMKKGAIECIHQYLVFQKAVDSVNTFLKSLSFENDVLNEMTADQLMDMVGLSFPQPTCSF